MVRAILNLRRSQPETGELEGFAQYKKIVEK